MGAGDRPHDFGEGLDLRSARRRRALIDPIPEADSLADVGYWHIADINADDEHVRFWG